MITDFKELVESSRKDGLFVDKTLLITAILDSKNPLLITRPRRWGKTLNMSMLFYFLAHRDQIKAMKGDVYAEQCDVLFEGLNIFNPALNADLDNIKSYLGQYPAIFISFALSGDDSSENTENPNWKTIKGFIVSRIASLFSEYSYLAEDLREQIACRHEEARRRSETIFNRELSNRIKTYKTQFNVEQISEEMQAKIYDDVAVSIKLFDRKSQLQEQKDLEKFERICDENPKGEEELSNSINFLAQLLSKRHGKPTYILVDEYDSLINKYFDSAKIVSHLTKTFSGIFSAFAKPNKLMNDHLKSVVFTGILRVAKANIFSGLNNVTDCTVLDEAFSAYYGFTKNEVRALLEKAHKSECMDKVEAWYNGYKMGTEIIYNPWSVMQFIENNVFRAYWVDTARPGIIKDIILNNKGHIINNQLRDIIKNGVHKTVSVEANKSVSVEDLRDPESIWSFLLHTGYLTAEHIHYNEESGMFDCQVRIPNTEIKGIYRLIIRSWLHAHAAIMGVIANIFEQDYEGLADNLQSMLKNHYGSALFSRQKDSVEEVYHSLLLIEFNKEASQEHYALLPEQYTGDGRADILFVDNKNKIVVPIELKRAHNLEHLGDSAEEAVKQAVDKKYGRDLKYHDYIHHPAIGVSFFGTYLAIRVAGSEKIVQRM
jgi:hypothetical protein